MMKIKFLETDGTRRTPIKETRLWKTRHYSCKSIFRDGVQLASSYQYHEWSGMLKELLNIRKYNLYSNTVLQSREST